jgi:hypothetical protein
MLKFLHSKNSDFWQTTAGICILPSLTTLALAIIGMEELINGEILTGILKIGIFIAVSSFAIFAFKRGNKLENLAIGKKNTPYTKWSKRMEFYRWRLNYKRNEEKNGYYRLIGWVEMYFSEKDFMGNKFICSRYFDTAIYKDDHIFINGVDIERINVINNIIDSNRFIEDTRKNFAELTDLCLERNNEMFILLYSTDKYLFELSLESLQVIDGLLTIAKEDIEEVILEKELMLKQINTDESILITKRLADELYISKQLENRRKELKSQMHFSN